MLLAALPALGTLGTAAGMTMAGAAIGAGGSLFSGFTSYMTSKANAAAFEAQADARISKGEFDAENAQNKYERTRGQAVANAGTTGLDLRSFSDALADSAMESALEIKAIKIGAQNEASSLRFQADTQRAQGRAAVVGSIFSAGGQVLGGAGKALSMMAPGGPGGMPSYASWATNTNVYRG